MEALIDGAAASGSSTRLVVEEETQIGAARRGATALGHLHGLGSDAVGRLAIIVTEAATNILRHAGRGVVVLRGLLAGPLPGIEVLALDKGPGIPDIHGAMRDGFSTLGTQGQGMGAMRRLADVFAIHSQHGLGTAVLARITDRPRPSNGPGNAASLDDRIGVVNVPMEGETECGDGWHVVVQHHRTSVLLVDGLGHGPEAAAVAAIAAKHFSRLAKGSPEAALVVFDAAMRGSRGAALSVATIDTHARTTRFAGVGNVDGRLLAIGTSEHLVPQAGIVGHTMPTVRTTNASWPVRARLVLHSDGVSGRWKLDAYPGLLSAHPALLAGVIYRDFARSRDDATVLVVGDPAPEHLQ